MCLSTLERRCPSKMHGGIITIRCHAGENTLLGILQRCAITIGRILRINGNLCIFKIKFRIHGYSIEHSVFRAVDHRASESVS